MKIKLRCVAGLAACLLAIGCAKSDPDPAVATPTVLLNHQRAALGSPIEITYRFVVAAEFPGFDEDCLVMVHFLEPDDVLMWTDDHKPPIPTSEWKPGQTIEYKRMSFVPVYPYLGEAEVRVGLYSPTRGNRLRLNADGGRDRSYKVGKLHLLPQTENIFLIYKDGWHPAEVAEASSSVEWQWTRKEATLAFRNPRRDVMLYLHLDGIPSYVSTPQNLTVVSMDEIVEQREVPQQEEIWTIPVSASQMGDADMAELRLLVAPTFVPSVLNASSGDNRELGIRVFNAFVEAR
jgi:hypothetical protein